MRSRRAGWFRGMSFSGMVLFRAGCIFRFSRVVPGVSGRRMLRFRRCMILRGTLFRWTIFGCVISSRRWRARFLRRHLRRMIGGSSGLGGYNAASTEFSRLSCRSDCWTPVVIRREQCTILTGGMDLLYLGCHWWSVVLVHVGFLLRSGASLNSALTAIESHVGIIVYDHRPVYVDVSDLGGVHIHDGSVVIESIVAPFAAVESVTAVSVSVIDSTIKSNFRHPVAIIPGVDAIVPTPITGGPEQAGFGCFHPGAGDPVVTIVVIPGPVAGSPHIAFTGALRLFVNRQGWGTDAHRNADSELRRGGGGENCLGKPSAVMRDLRDLKDGGVSSCSSGPVGLPSPAAAPQTGESGSGKVPARSTSAAGGEPTTSGLCKTSEVGVGCWARSCVDCKEL